MRYLIFASPIFLAACGEPIEAGLPPPPREWLSCKEMPVAPDLRPLERITLPDGRVVYLARETNARDAAIAKWIVEVRERHFECWNNAEKLRGYYKQ